MIHGQCVKCSFNSVDCSFCIATKYVIIHLLQFVIACSSNQEGGTHEKVISLEFSISNQSSQAILYIYLEIQITCTV